ncbi:unnamed protein product [Somion occarium]|uniref:Uncharacterized protein n=1 Tax=Somion occarium TaxID=3059160 RepID=A0ABP1E5G7_9APHY
MSEYIDIPRDLQKLRVPSSSYGRRDDGPYPTNAPAPHVTRVSYGSTMGNRPSWNSNFFPSTNRPPSQPLGPRQVSSSVSGPASSQSPPPPGGNPPPRPWAAKQSFDTNFPDPARLRPSIQAPTYIEPPSQYANDQSWVSVHPNAPRGNAPLRIDIPAPQTESGHRTSEMDGVPRSSQGEYNTQSQALSHPSHWETEEGSVGEEPESGSDGEVAENMTIDRDAREEYPTPHTNPIVDSMYQMEGNVWTPPEKAKKSRGFPFGGFMSKLRKKPKNAPFEPQNPPSPPLAGPPYTSTPLTKSPLGSPSRPVRMPSSPPKKPAITPLQPTNAPQRTPSQNQRQRQNWYTSHQEDVRSPPILQERIELPKSNTPTGSVSTSTRSSQVMPIPRPAPEPPLDLPNPHESQLVTADPDTIAEPIQVHPQHAPDYDQMSLPEEDSRDDSFGTQMYRFGQFVMDLIHLPWMAKPATVNYDPRQSSRARLGKPAKSWYTKPGQEKVDLLATPKTSRPPPRPKAQRPPRSMSQRPPRPSRLQSRAASHSRHHRHHRSPTSIDAVTAIRPTRTPMTATSAGMVPTSPGASSHGHGHHSYTCSYYYNHDGPRPLYLYPSAVAPKAPGGEEGAMAKPDITQVQPVYIIAAGPPDCRHHSHRQHALKPSSPNRGIRMPSPQTVRTDLLS